MKELAGRAAAAMAQVDFRLLQSDWADSVPVQ